MARRDVLLDQISAGCGLCLLWGRSRRRCRFSSTRPVLQFKQANELLHARLWKGFSFYGSCWGSNLCITYVCGIAILVRVEGIISLELARRGLVSHDRVLHLFSLDGALWWGWGKLLAVRNDRRWEWLHWWVDYRCRWDMRGGSVADKKLERGWCAATGKAS